MDNTPVIRPRPWLLIGSIAALILVPSILAYVPNPFADLAPGERPSRFFMVLWLCLPALIALAAWRVLTWTTYRATSEALEARGWFGATRFAWRELTSSALDTPVGMPPAYELRFGKRKIRFIAAHHERAVVQSLRSYITR